MARSNFSGAMLGWPPLISASYICANNRSIFTSAWLAIVRIERSGWDFGTKSSSLRMVNKLSVKVSAPRMNVGSDEVLKSTLRPVVALTSAGGISAAC
ncbi:hypothetical protein, partial [Cupriavidus sp. SK-4]|uniref:hypothetical protein n=1 Tax=Cupriavidus sp. SK-4 TaxID=574750 RepID=UPI001F34C950